MSTQTSIQSANGNIVGHIAVLGLGAMGSRMAAKLLSAGHQVAVYNRSPGRADELVAQGAHLAASPRDAVRGCKVAISMVRDDDAARAIWLDEETGALAAMDPSAIAIESSTLTPAFVAELARKCAARDIALLDAPVAGSRPQAAAGQLIYLVGGRSDALDRVRDLLSLMGGAIHHVGPTGTGAVMKLAVNALFGIQVAALGEMLGMTSKAGIPLEQAVELLGTMPITSPAIKGVGGLIAAGKFAPMFPIDLVEKDFRYIEEAADALDADTPTASAVRAVYASAKTNDLGNENINAVAKLFLPQS